MMVLWNGHWFAVLADLLAATLWLSFPRLPLDYARGKARDRQDKFGKKIEKGRLSGTGGGFEIPGILSHAGGWFYHWRFARSTNLPVCQRPTVWWDISIGRRYGRRRLLKCPAGICCAIREFGEWWVKNELTDYRRERSIQKDGGIESSAYELSLKCGNLYLVKALAYIFKIAWKFKPR